LDAFPSVEERETARMLIETQDWDGVATLNIEVEAIKPVHAHDVGVAGVARFNSAYFEENFDDGVSNYEAACMEPISRQIGCDLAAAKERVFRKVPVDFVHELQRLGIHADRGGIQ
jgi:hypothetical protein